MTTSAEPVNALDALGLQPVRPQRMSERVYASLFHSVMSGRLAPGARLPPELELAARFAVSRPVVRQALERLRRDGLIASQRGSGSYVREAQPPVVVPEVPLAQSSTDLSHIAYGMELRLVVEPESAYLAALRRTPRDLARIEEMVEQLEQSMHAGVEAHAYDYGFHEAIAQATANPRLVAVLRTLEFDVSHAVHVWRHLARLQPWRGVQQALDEHRGLLALIRAQDAEGARRAMRGHLENARMRMLELAPGR